MNKGKFQDASGEQFLKQYRDPTYGQEIVERDDGYIEASKFAVRYFSDFSKWAKTEQEAMRLVKGRVLDIGCGAGRHSLYLQKKGFDVTGIDNSPGAIKVCKLRGVKKTRVMSINEVDVFTPKFFDTIIMMGNNFALFGSPKKTRRLLKKLYKITTQDAQILGETRDPYKTSNPVHLAYHKFNKARGRWSGQLRLRVRVGKTVGKWFDYFFVSPEELRKVLSDTGWKLTKIIKSKGSDYIGVIKKLPYAR